MPFDFEPSNVRTTLPAAGQISAMLEAGLTADSTGAEGAGRQAAGTAGAGGRRRRCGGRAGRRRAQRSWRLRSHRGSSSGSSARCSIPTCGYRARSCRAYRRARRDRTRRARSRTRRAGAAQAAAKSRFVVVPNIEPRKTLPRVTRQATSDFNGFDPRTAVWAVLGAAAPGSTRCLTAFPACLSSLRFSRRAEGRESAAWPFRSRPARAGAARGRCGSRPAGRATARRNRSRIRLRCGS